jgi:hypothetical protein
VRPPVIYTWRDWLALFVGYVAGLFIIAAIKHAARETRDHSLPAPRRCRITRRSGASTDRRAGAICSSVTATETTQRRGPS